MGVEGFVEPTDPYCGFVRRMVNGREVLKEAKGAPHLLISGMTGVGKSRRLLTPCAVTWGGPAVVVSSKDDLMQLVMERRWGPKALIDLRPIALPVYPDGLKRFSYDPTTTITTPMEALTVAETIMQMATVGVGSGIDQVSDSGVWESNAAGPLAAFLYAASPCGNGQGMKWVLRAVDNVSDSKHDDEAAAAGQVANTVYDAIYALPEHKVSSVRILLAQLRKLGQKFAEARVRDAVDDLIVDGRVVGVFGQRGIQGYEAVEPPSEVIELDLQMPEPEPDGDEQPEPEASWQDAAKFCGRFDVLAIGLKRIANMSGPQRDSVAITMRKGVTPWTRTALTAQYDPSLIAPAFDPQFLDDEMATLFVLAPADGTVAGAAVTLLDCLVRRWREKTSRREQMHRLLMVIDELPNTAPIPSLRRIVGEARGLGINLVAAVQASVQLDTVYGHTYAEELRAIFPAALVMKGARERELLEAGQDWSPLTTRHPESWNPSDGQKSLGSELGPRMRWQELLPQSRESARLLIRGEVGVTVEIPDWTVFRDYYDATWKAMVNGSAAGQASTEHARRLDGLRRLWATGLLANRRP